MIFLIFEPLGSFFMPKIIVNLFFRVTRMVDKNGGFRKLHDQPSSLISPTFSSVISRMSVQDRRFLKVSSSLVPLVNKSPRNTELYKLMMSNVKC